MCLAIPGKIKNIEGRRVFVEYPGEVPEVREVLVGDEQVRVGDWVLVQMGIVIKILSPEEVEVTREVCNIHGMWQAQS